MLARVLDQNSNLPILSKNSSWREASALNLATSVNSNLRKLSRNITAWIYEQLKRNDNQTQNFIIYYQLTGILLAEVSDIDLQTDLQIQLLKVFLAIQDL